MVLHVWAGKGTLPTVADSPWAGQRATGTRHDGSAGRHRDAVLLGHPCERLERRREVRVWPLGPRTIRLHRGQIPHLGAVGPFETLRGPHVALLGSRAVVWVLWDPLRSTCRSVHGAHGGRTPVGSWSGAHPSWGHARGAAGARVGNELVVVGRTSHLSVTKTHNQTSQVMTEALTLVSSY